MSKDMDLKISGVANMNGGSFEHVDISGVGRISGDLEAKSIIISGVGKLEGSARTAGMNISGSAHVEGNMEVETLKSSGSISVDGSFQAKRIVNSGKLLIKGSLKTGELESQGLTTVEGDAEAEKFQVEGAFKVEGLLNASVVEVMLGGPCHAGEIGGESIRIHRGKSTGLQNLLPLNLFKAGNRLQCRTIEGTDIYLENTRAEFVRGSRVYIGPGCSIGQVEYIESFEAVPESTVKSSVKI